MGLGRPDRLTINQACELVFKLMDWRPRQINRDLSKPQGVASRAADINRAQRVLGWEPKVSYEEGFKRTIDWYTSHRDKEFVRINLDKLLMER